ncbi:MAG: GAF domain-containing protein [Chloroherpetonaceae bacterium]|nr:GAF domain-containing protein [Chloroherpetonaceae bacterium]
MSKNTLPERIRYAGKIQLYDHVGLETSALQTGLKRMHHVYDYHSPAHSRAIIEHPNILPTADILFLADVSTAHRIRRTLAQHAKRRFAIAIIAAPEELADFPDPTELLDKSIIDILETPISANEFAILLRRVQMFFQNQERFDLLRHELTEQRNELHKLNDIGMALSSERDVTKLLEMILSICMEITGADAGSVYVVEDKPGVPADPANYFANKQLRFRHTKNFSKQVPFKEFTMPISRNSIVGAATLSGVPLNIPDVYEIPPDATYSFNRGFDMASGYRTKSMLTVPMLNRNKETIGAIQLLNKKSDPNVILSDEAATAKYVIPFDKNDEDFIYSLASQAAIALENQILFEAHRNLLEAFIRLIAEAIDRKSPYTGGHCNRVPVLTEMLAKAACESQEEPFKDFNLTDEQWYELHIAAWLHDCGKIVTPVNIMDKATKLEKIYDRIHTVKTRFEVLRRDLQIEYLKALQHPNGRSKEELEEEYQRKLRELSEEEAFLEKVNIGGEYLDDESIERIKRIGHRKLVLNGEERRLLDDDEIYNLSIRRGTLTAEERKIINDHIVITIEMLEKLPFPRNLMRVPEYAGGHHEKMDGTGYPRGLTREQMSIPARIMAIADVFEALTAVDRPYKRGKKLSEAMEIMGKMKAENHLDPDLFDLFVKSGVYRKYAEMYMSPELIDEVDEESLLRIKPISRKVKEEPVSSPATVSEPVSES